MRVGRWIRGMGITLLGVLAVMLLVVSLALQDRPAARSAGVQHWTDGAAGRIEYAVRGTGPTLLLLPSFARSASDFDQLGAELVNAGFQVITPQPRGVGGTELGPLGADLWALADDLKAVLDNESITTPVLILGHAFGNRVARVFATRYPERVGALILLAAGGAEPPPPAVSASIQTALFGFWSAGAREQAVQEAFFAPGNPVSADWLIGWYPLTGLLQTGAITRTPYESWASGGDKPVLIVQAQADRPAPVAQARAFAQRYPQRTELVEIAQAGHALLPEQPQQVARAVIDFALRHTNPVVAPKEMP